MVFKFQRQNYYNTVLVNPTRMDKYGHVSIQGEALRGFKLQIKIRLLRTNFVHIVAGHKRDTWDRKNTRIMEKLKNLTSQQVLGRKTQIFKKYKDQMTAMARSLGLKGGWLHFHWKIPWNHSIGKNRSLSLGLN